MINGCNRAMRGCVAGWPLLVVFVLIADVAGDFSDVRYWLVNTDYLWAHESGPMKQAKYGSTVCRLTSKVNTVFVIKSHS
ncbi:MAG: hypothetical protein P8L31_12645 [Pseudomonadales bacterium]|nr:hypothetical protein [Pseudomonadales bacterium]